jgi:hypothetical protein
MLFIYIQHGSSKFMDVNSFVTPKSKFMLPKKIEIKITDVFLTKHSINLGRSHGLGTKQAVY